MATGKRNFDLAALTWDEKPQRIKLAKDIFSTLEGAVNITDGMEALDFGSGTGLLSLQMLERTGSVTCADSSRGMLEVLMSKVKYAGLNGVRTIHLGSDDGEGLHGNYDIITSSMTFHHVQDISPLVKKLSGLLKPGGVLCVADLDPDDGKFHENSTGVYHNGFSRKEMEKCFRDAGLDDVKSMTAAVVDKKNEAGETVSFTVFLITGRNSGNRNS